jgi:hypothetical protein
MVQRGFGGGGSARRNEYVIFSASLEIFSVALLVVAVGLVAEAAVNAELKENFVSK